LRLETAGSSFIIGMVRNILQRTIFHETNIILVGIVYCAIASALVWWVGFAHPASLLVLYNIPRLDMLYINVGGTPVLVRLIISFVVLGGSYWFAYQWAGLARGRAAWVAVLVGAALQAAILIYMAPFNSTDIFDNISHGRMLGLFHVNPFHYVAGQFPRDPFTRFNGWPDAPSAYGPLWEQVAAVTARIAGNGMVQNVIAFKLLPGLFWAGCVAMVAIILRKRAPGSALKGTLFIAWNPVALFEIFGNGHNDPSFLLWVAVAVWAMLERRYTIAILSLVVGTLFKFMPAVLIPAAGLIALQELPTWKRRVGFVLPTSALSVALIALAYAPFWEGTRTLSIDRRAHLFTTTIGSSINNAIAPHIGAARAGNLISPVAALLTLAFALWMAYRAMRSKAPDRFALASIQTFSFYLLVTVLSFWPWYTLWLILLAPLVRDKQLRTLAIVFAFAALSKDMFNFISFNASQSILPQPWMEVWLTLRVMLLPWLYAIYALITRGRGASLVPEVSFSRAKISRDTTADQ
jgi:hypothetical protein